MQIEGYIFHSYTKKIEHFILDNPELKSKQEDEQVKVYEDCKEKFNKLRADENQYYLDNPDKNRPEEDVTYIQKNRGRISASKLKYFLSYGPECYKLKYIDEIPTGDEDKRYFILGTAFDDLCSYGREAFFKKYAIKEAGLLKADLVDRLTERGENFDPKAKVGELTELYYGDKILLSTSEGATIVGMYREVGRQKLANMGGDYTAQETIEAEYNGLKIKGTLDRFSLERKEIRDWKTSANITYFEYNIDTTFDYVMSMAFYYTLVKLQYGVNCDVILDVLGKQKPYPYFGYMLRKADLLEKLEHKIKPGLDALAECMRTGVWESINPIQYETAGRNGEVILHLKGEPVGRGKLMESGLYHLLDGSQQQDFIYPRE